MFPSGIQISWKTFDVDIFGFLSGITFTHFLLASSIYTIKILQPDFEG
jgi:hypothetical protein